MNIDPRFAAVRRFCEAHADPTIVEKYRKYFVEGYDPYGLTSEIINAQRDAWLREWEGLGLNGFLDLGDRLVATGKYEEATFAILFAAAFKARFEAGTLPRLGRWLDAGLRNWAHVDVFSGEVLSPFVTGRLVPIDAFSPWRSAPSKWKRRAVPVTLIAAVKTGAVPIPRLLAFVDAMMADEEKVVRQGLGWFLREAWKKQPAAVETFLMKWKDRCGRLIVQYATEKMSPAKKAQFKAARPAGTRVSRTVSAKPPLPPRMKTRPRTPARPRRGA